MRTAITSVLLVSSLLASAQGQNLENLWKLYQHRQYDQVIAEATALLDGDVNQTELNLLLGRAHTDIDRYKDAIPYLDFVVTHDSHNTWRKAWALGYLGTCYYLTGQYDKSKAALEECIEVNATKNATEDAGIKIPLFGFDDFYKPWKVLSSDHFNFHFQNMSANDMDTFVARGEDSYEQINSFFQSRMPKKIDFFVWTSKEDEKRILNTDIGFARPDVCIVHSHFDQTPGHEMTHVISNYSTRILRKTGLINEGTAVCFDLSNGNHEQKVKDWIKANGKTVSLRDLWTNWNIYPTKVSYPLSGLFVQALIHTFGKTRFIAFFKDQTYENGKLVFGEKLDDVIGEVENSVNK
jgi:tetratricopeptide (TPR) repeat protein